jgi:hAT family C-terminal dimerisation region
MTDKQYASAESELLGRLQTMRENESGARLVIPKESSSGGDVDTLDDEYDQPISSEHQAALNEWIQYQRLVKYGKYFPKKYKKEGLLEIGDIRFGVVEERGDDIEANHPFKTCNLADYIDDKGYFNLVKFIGYNQQTFPFIYKLACCIASMRVNEVGCERFFSIAGYVSNPRRTSLKVRHYEALAMLKLNMQRIYIDEDWVVQQYQRMEKSKEWDAMDTQDDELVAALELELYAGDCGVPVEALQLSEIESDGVEETVHVAAAAEGAIEVVDGDSENSSIGSDTDSDLEEG